MIHERRGLGHWQDSYGVGMKQAPRPPDYVQPKSWADQALLDMAERARVEEAQWPVYDFSHFDKIARRDTRHATAKAAAILAAAYFAAWVISWL